MLQNVTADTRLKLIRARGDAHSGRIDDSLSVLVALAEDSTITASPLDALAVHLLKAELSYLDERDQEAFDELKELTGSLSKATAPTVEMSVRRNFVSVGTALFDAGSRQGRAHLKEFTHNCDAHTSQLCP